MTITSKVTLIKVTLITALLSGFSPLFANPQDANTQESKQPLKWFYEEAEINSRLDFAWMGNSKGASVESPLKKGNLRGVSISRDEFYEGEASLKFHFTKEKPDTWAFAATTCGDITTGREAKSWDEVDAGKDISSVSHVTFYLKGEGDARIQIKDANDQGSSKVKLSDYGKFEKDKWNKFSIPLKDLDLDQNLIELTQVKVINILAEQDCPVGAGEWVFYIDNLGFEAISGPILKPISIPAYEGAKITALKGITYVTSVDQGSGKEKNYKKKGKELGLLYNQDQDKRKKLLRRMPFPAAPNTGEESASTLKFTINPEKQHQAVWGLGASMTDSSAFVLGNLKKNNKELYDFTMNKLFSTKDGAGFRVIRLVVGASDYTASKEFYTYCDEKSEDLSKFSIARDKEFLIPVLKDALAINPDIVFFATPWTAPGWMKSNEDMNGITKEQKAEGAKNRLKSEYVETFARYLCKFVEGYGNEGISVKFLTLQNEPQFDAAHYPCMRVTKDDYVELIKAFAKVTQEKGMDTKVLLHDHNWILHPNDTKVIGGDRKMDPYTLVKELQSMKELSPTILGSAWHCYSGTDVDMKRVYTSLRKDFKDTVIITSEATAWKKVRDAKWDGDLSWSLDNNWYGTFKNGGTAAMQWNLVLDHKYGPTPRKDSEAYGLISVHTDTYKEARLEREFYAMAQISKAIGGGGHLIEGILHKDSKPSALLKTLAFKRTDGSIGVFLINSAKKKEANMTINYRNLSYDVSVPKNSMVTYILTESK